MLGERALRNSMIATNDEGFEQYKLVANEIDKLVDITKTGWSLVPNKVLDKVRVVSFLEGGAIAIVGCMFGYVIGECVIEKL